MNLAAVVDPGPTREAFFELASVGVWAGVAVACLLCFVLGQYFVKAVA